MTRQALRSKGVLPYAPAFQAASALITILIALTVATAFAAPLRHECSIAAGGGFPRTALGDLGYAFFFTPNFGVRTGVGASVFELKSSGDASGAFHATDAEHESLEILWQAQYSEKRWAAMLRIPLMLQFQTGYFYAALGAELGIPLKAEYAIDASSLSLVGRFDGYEEDFTAPAMGFGERGPASGSGKANFALAWNARAEMGLKWRPSDHTALYTGLWGSYGINNLQKPEGAFFEWKQTGALQLASVAQATHPWMFGGEIRFAFGLAGFAQNIGRTSAPLQTPGQAPNITIFNNAFILGSQDTVHTVAKDTIHTVVRDTVHTVVHDTVAKPVPQQPAAKAPKDIKQEFSRLDSLQNQFVHVETIKNGKKLTLSAVLFHTGSATLTHEAEIQLARIAGILSVLTDARIQVAGYTDSEGEAHKNVLLSLHRADSVRDFFVQQGIDANRIGTIGYGEQFPIASNATAQGREKNRRVEIRITAPH
jgi:outer membrane protein OmpA-like peptidoglycan-associated protein